MVEKPLTRFRRLWKRKGLLEATKRSQEYCLSVAHNTVKKFLPSHTITSNGVRHIAKLGDKPNTLIGIGSADYEDPNISWLRKHAEKEDRVVIIGGGFGVTAKLCSTECDLVWVIEPSKKHLETYIKPQGNNIIGIHAYIANPENAYGSASEATMLKSEDLPPCEILEIDCEGGEQEILKHMVIRPRLVIVETHPQFGTDNEEIKQRLQTMEYELEEVVIDREREDQNMLVIKATR
jgi:hypothetical protein